MVKATFDLEENIASMLCYVLTWLTGIIFYLVEKENKTVRFHALQSTLTFIPLTILGWVLGFIGAPSVSYGGGYGWYGTGVTVNPGIPALIWASYGIWALTVILWIVFVIKAYQGEKFKLPIIGDIAEKHA
ncbi:MAG: DUF4870 domain-containing protein [Candidatus Thermoplasmatota archaeon]|nr:DUF4870 domain-containing protein [Candidatus Thermoplasmatota archaeon]